MEYGFLSRAGKFLQEQRKHRRWMMMFLCLAGGVTLGTLAFLKLYGQAMTHQVKMLDCQYEVHVHTEDCYEENEDGEEVLVCEYADYAEYVIHVHNDDCYDQKGNLVCPMEEHELHEHDDDCWEEEDVLICGEEEAEGSTERSESGTKAAETVAVSDDSQDAKKESGSDAGSGKELACEKEEHKHDDSCYDGGSGCDLEEHTHNDGCYDKTETLVCEESEHTHDDGCYSEVRGERNCGESEHEHDDGCYDEDGEFNCDKDEHSHDDNCYEVTEELTCGENEHTHGGSCYEVTEKLTCEIKEHEHDDSCEADSELTCKIEEHEHDDSCYVETKAETEKKETSRSAKEDVQEEVKETNDSKEAEEGHTHTDDCYETEEVMTCGELELHIHDDSCYDEDCFDEDGNLIEGSRVSCGLLQLEEHVHTEECFKIVELTPEEIAALNGGATLHVHSDECYDEDGNLICGHEVTHLHQLECYDEDGNLICGFGVKEETHEHDANCYDEEGNLICGHEDAKDHEHDEDCYDEDGNLICGYETEKVHQHVESCYDEEGNLICGYKTDKVHEHDLTCYDEDGNLICGYETEKVHEHSESCYDEDGNLICGYVTEEVYDNEKVYESEGYIVTVKYNDDAEIPEEAELIAEQITVESDEEHYAQRETEFQQMVDGEDVSMRALFKIGFYLDGEEVEPKNAVSVKIQFLDEKGLEEGKPITVVHFAKEGAEKLDGSEAKDSSTSFKVRSFSEIAIGYETDDVTIYISEPYEYETEDFHILFHIKGEVTLPGDKISRSEIEEGVAGTETLDETETSDDTGAPIIEAGSEENATDGENTSQQEPAESDPLAKELEFNVLSLDENSEEYITFLAYTENEEEEKDLSILQVLSYSLFYKGVDLNLLECEVTAEITPTVALLETAADYIQTYTTEDGEIVENGLAVNVYEQVETGGVSGLDGLYITEDILEEAEKDMLSDVSSYSLRNDGSDIITGDIPDDSGVDKESVADEQNAAGAEETEVEISPITMKVNLTGNICAVSGTSSLANPGFKVQYYAWLDRMVTTTTGEAKSSIIDTSGGKLPTNVNPISLRYFTVDGSGKINSKETLTEVYKNKDYFFAEAPNLAYFDELTIGNKGSYALFEIWVTNDEKVAAGTNRNEWDVYTNPKNVGFTNRKETKDSNPGYYILVSSNTVIRLVYKVDRDVVPYNATFYDYDIGPGYWDMVNTTAKRLDTRSSGINSSKNCNADVKYAFGNSNAGTNYGKKLWNGNLLNAGNTTGNGSTRTVHRGCTFGLVSGLNAAKNDVKFNVAAPQVFGDTDKNIDGKTIYDGYKLNFIRNGDTYTLSSVTNSKYGTVAGGLETLIHPKCGATTYDHIWTNLFWPMDAERKANPANHDFMFGDRGQQNNQLFYKLNASGKPTTSYAQLPLSDDGIDHNSYFGMYYTLTFELSEDYVGPLEYIFFGDDDMWVFLDDTLVCDIGGVHSTVGEYVNLWDYLGTPNADGTGRVADGTGTKTHTLKFFYTERGASGSTCWMQFTLPSVESVSEQIKGQVTNHLKVGKTLAGANIPEGLEYEFKINFKNDNGSLLNNYSYAKHDSEENVVDNLSDVLISDGETFRLGNGEHIVVNYLPVGTTYTITETGRAFLRGTDTLINGEDKKYDVIVDVNGEGKNVGAVTEDEVTEGNITITYINNYGYELPKTGGPGLEVYTVAGVLLMIFGAGFVYRKKFRERRA